MSSRGETGPGSIFSDNSAIKQNLTIKMYQNNAELCALDEEKKDPVKVKLS